MGLGLRISLGVNGRDGLGVSRFKRPCACFRGRLLQQGLTFGLQRARRRYARKPGGLLQKPVTAGRFLGLACSVTPQLEIVPLQYAGSGALLVCGRLTAGDPLDDRSLGL